MSVQITALACLTVTSTERDTSNDLSKLTESASMCGNGILIRLDVSLPQSYKAHPQSVWCVTAILFSLRYMQRCWKGMNTLGWAWLRFAAVGGCLP